MFYDTRTQQWSGDGCWVYNETDTYTVATGSIIGNGISRWLWGSSNAQPAPAAASAAPAAAAAPAAQHEVSAASAPVEPPRPRYIPIVQTGRSQPSQVEEKDTRTEEAAVCATFNEAFRSCLLNHRDSISQCQGLFDGLLQCKRDAGFVVTRESIL